MKKSLALTLLILLGSFVTTMIPLGAIACERFTEIPFAVPIFAAIAAIMMQTAVFARLRRLYKTKYGLSSPKFVVCSVLPPVGIALIGMIVIKFMINAGVFGEANPRLYSDDRARAELLSAWTVILYAVCFTVILSLTLAVISVIEKRSDCPKKSFIQLSAAVNGILMLVLGIVFILINRTDWIFLTGLIVLILHIAVSVIVFLRSERKFGVRSNEFLCLTGLPAVLLNGVMFTLSLLFVCIGGGDLGYGFAAVSMFAGMYSLAYFIGTAAVTGFCKLLK